jgi:hypothetical protein
MKFYSKKIIELKNADIHLHYANNKGRGSDNVTVTFVPSGSDRHANSKYSDNQYFKQYRVSGWSGNVNIPTDDIKNYGGLK